jgi:conjugative transfer region protein (TIGR03748 family)
MKCLALKLVVVLMFSGAAMAEPVSTGRYSVAVPMPSSVELDPLSQNVMVSFPSSVINVGDALNYVLSRSGWVLPDDQLLDPALVSIMSRPLPESHRKLSLMPVRKVLSVLVGHYFLPVEDPIGRLYNFEIKPQYKALRNDTTR